MEFKLKTGQPEKQTSACIVALVGADNSLSPAAAALDKASSGAIKNILKQGDLAEKAGSTLLIPALAGIKAQRVLLVSSGGKKALEPKQFATLVKSTITALQKTNAANALLYLNEAEVDGRDRQWQIRQTIELLEDACYSFSDCKSKKAKAPTLKQINIAINGERGKAQKALDQAQAIANGKSLTRTLGNLPGNICTPTYLAEQAAALGKKHKKLSVKVLSEAQMKKLGMGSLLSVSAGSDEPAKLIIMHHKGGKTDAKPQVLVGKGITFDTGGISLKPGGAMDEMKFDMCGAASVFGTMQAVAEMDLPMNVIGVVAAAENMPSGGATKPGDIVTSMSGQTIEILNTDAEGRLVLCDALTYVERFKPAAVVDVATLTGACIMALGHHTTAVIANDDGLSDKLQAAGQHTLDKAWPLPLWDEYQSQLDSNFADIANIGGRPAGTITAACFLSRFTKKYKWAHLDIAGTAWHSGKAKGATGRPVPLLTQYLLDCL